MYILGDIGNTDTKIFLVSKRNKILKRINETKVNKPVQLPVLNEKRNEGSYI